MTKEEFLSEFSSDYNQLSNIYNRYQIYIFSENLDWKYESKYNIVKDTDRYLLNYIIEYYDIIYYIVNTIFKMNNPELIDNLNIIKDSLDLTEIFSLYSYRINVNISKLINNIKNILIDLDLYKEVDIDKYYVESVLNKLLPYKITTHETN